LIEVDAQQYLERMRNVTTQLATIRSELGYFGDCCAILDNMIQTWHGVLVLRHAYDNTIKLSRVDAAENSQEKEGSNRSAQFYSRLTQVGTGWFFLLSVLTGNQNQINAGNEG
jgi:hypothetical protein